MTLKDRKGINLQMPSALIDQVDELRGDKPRAIWIREAIEHEVAIQMGHDGPMPSRQKAIASTRSGKKLVDKALLPSPAIVPGGECKKHGVNTQYKFGALICMECGTVMR